MQNIELRQVLIEDQDFIFDTYKANLQPYVEWAWGWNEAFQRNGFWTHHPIEQFQVVMVDKQIAGGLHVQEQDALNFVRMVFLLPEFQNRGIGAQLLRRQYARAKEADKHLHLKVVKINPAKRLYERLGFTVIEEDKATYHMRWI